MISSKNLVTTTNAQIEQENLSELDLTQLSGIQLNLSQSRALQVSTVSDLPDAANNKGRLVFVTENNKYYGSDGAEWSTDFSVQELVSVAYAWGSGADGALGDGTVVAKSSPVTVVGGITNWRQVSAGSALHSLGIAEDGVAYAWGNNNGQLGDGTNVNRTSPVTVVGDITNWSQLSAGNSHSLGLTEDGVAYAWGSGTNGRLGDDTTVTRSSPVTVAGDITNWRQVSAGNNHSLGVTRDGIAYAWGANTGINVGSLGDGTLIPRSSPVTVVGGITNWSQVSAGNSHHSLGVTRDGIAYAWGNGRDGQLGDGTTVDRSSPVTVVGDITNWSQVSAGSNHSLGLTEDGIAYAWGFGTLVGDGTNVARSSPVTVVGGITNWSQVSAGLNHSLGLTQDGIAYAWGSGSEGQLGDSTTTNKTSPVTVAGDITNWGQVSGGRHSLGIQIRERGL